MDSFTAHKKHSLGIKVTQAEAEARRTTETKSQQ